MQAAGNCTGWIGADSKRDAAGSIEDQGLLTKEQERELRMYVTKPGHTADPNTQQEMLQEVRQLLGYVRETEA